MSVKTIQNLVSEAMSEIKTIDAGEAYQMVQNKNCNLIDIRESNELENTGSVEGASHIPRGMLEFWLDPQSSYYQTNKIGDIKNIVLFCALGFRSALATKALKEMGFDNVANANGGFDSLKKIGLPVIAKEKK